MPRASRSAPRPASSSAPASESAAPATGPSGGGAEGAPGNGLLVFFGVIATIFGFLSTVELRFGGGGAGPVFLATLGLCGLMVVLAAAYKAEWRPSGAGAGRPRAPVPIDRTPAPHPPAQVVRKIRRR